MASGSTERAAARRRAQRLAATAFLALAAPAISWSAGDAVLGVPPDRVAPAGSRIVALGRQLFMDRRLSVNGTMSCGMCHVPEQGFTVNDIATAVGLEGRSLKRNAPTVLNVGLHRTLFHDGRAASLEDQVWGPLLSREEMGNGTRANVVRRVAALAGYRRSFSAAFPKRGITPGTIAAALAAYERALVSGGSPFDRWRYGGEAGAMSAAAQRGLELFEGKAGCSACHLIGPHDAALTDHGFHNTGTSALSRSRKSAGYGVPLAPGVAAHVAHDALAAAFGELADDLGRREATGSPEDTGRFKTPSLRNVALTAPYMHDGSLATLEEVIAFYDRGGAGDPAQDPRIRPLGLDAVERQDLAAFLAALTGANVAALARDARRSASVPTFGGPGR